MSVGFFFFFQLKKYILHLGPVLRRIWG